MRIIHICDVIFEDNSRKFNNYCYLMNTTGNFLLNLNTSMIIWHSIIFKIITFIVYISKYFKTHILYLELFYKNVTCDEVMWKFFVSPENRDYIIHVMRHMDLPCFIINYTDTKIENTLFSPYFARIIT
jgi:hypothetical protein